VGAACSRLGWQAQLTLRPLFGLVLGASSLGSGSFWWCCSQIWLLVFVQQLRVEAGCLAVGEQAMLRELWQDEIVGILLSAGVGTEEVDLQIPLGLGAANSSLGLFRVALAK